MRPKLLLLLQGILSLVILGRLAVMVQAPLDLDENDQGYCIYDPAMGLGRYNLRFPCNHALATVASAVSMHFLGVSKFSMRLPSLLFAAAFLCLLNFICFRLNHFAFSALVLGHLASNPLALWLLQSSRGYSAALFFALVEVAIIWGWISGQLRKIRRGTIGLTLCGFLGMFTHTFGTVAFLLLGAAVLVWLKLNAKSLGAKVVEEGKQLCFPFFVAMPLAVFMGFCLYLTLDRNHQISADWNLGVGSVLTAFFMTFGFAQNVWGILLMAFCAILFAIKQREGFSWKKDPLFIYFALGISIFSVGVCLAKPLYFFPRFLSSFWPAALLWIAYSASELHDKWVRLGVFGFAFVLLVAVPVAQKLPAEFFFHEHEARFDRFITYANKWTGAPGACISIEGSEPYFTWADVFRLRSLERNRHKKDGCRSRYLVAFGFESQNLNQKVEQKFGSPVILQLLYRPEQDLALYQVAVK